MRTEIRLTAGTQHSGALALSNDSESRVRVSAQTLDFYLDDDANPQFGREWPAEAPFSCRQWLSLNPMETELDPQGQIQVRYSVRVPAGTPERSYHCAAGFSTLPVAGNMQGTGIRTAVRVIAAFYVIVGSPRVEGAVKSMRIEPVPQSPDGGLRVAVVIENTGDIYFRPTGTLEVLDAAGRVIHTAQFVPIPVLPRRSQRMLFPLALRETDSCALRARVDLGMKEIQEVTASGAAANAH